MGHILPSNARKVFAVIVLLVFGAGHSGVAQLRHDFFIHLDSNDSLDATSFIPNQPQPPHGFPTLLFVHGFGSDKFARVPSCSVYAANGYLTLAYTVRGHGRSSGLSTIMSKGERRDLARVFEFLKHMPQVDSLSIGIAGGSQGGLHGLWAAIDQLPVKAISTDVIVPSWASDMLMNGSIRRTMLLLLNTSTVRYSPFRDTLWNYVRWGAYDSLLKYFPRDRDVDTALLRQSQIPILTFLKWQDHYFSPSDGIKSFQRLNTPKKLYVGTYGHFSDTDSAENYFQSDQIFRWFGNFIMKKRTGILDEPPITYAYSSLPMDSLDRFCWLHARVSSWPPDGLHSVKFFLRQDSVLSYSPSRKQLASVTLYNRYRDSTYTFDKAFTEGFRSSRFNTIIPHSTLSFASPVLATDVLWIGIPRMHLFVRSKGTQFPLHAQIFEIDSTGRKHFINRINFTARHWKPGSSGWITAEGVPHAHKFSRGSRIGIDLTNIDKTNRRETGDYPFVVPLFANTSVTVYGDAVHSSYIELQMISSPESEK